MATSRVKTVLFLTFEIATKWQNVCYTQQSYRLISLNQARKKAQVTLLILLNLFSLFVY